MHFPSEIKEVDDKVNKNSLDILAYESRLKQKEDLTNELERYLFSIIITTNNLICLLNQNLNHLVEIMVILTIAY